MKHTKNRQSLSTPRVWTFGCLEPQTEAEQELLNEFLHAQNNYYNILIESNKIFRDQVHALRLKQFPRLAKLEEQKNKLLMERAEIDRGIRRLRQKLGAEGIKKRISLSDDEKIRVTEIKAGLKHLNEKIKEERSKCKDDVKPLQDYIKRKANEKMKAMGVSSPNVKGKVNAEITEKALKNTAKFSRYAREYVRLASERLKRDKEARRDTILLDGTYNMVSHSVDQAIKTHAIGLPEFKRFNGTGYIGVQFKSGGASSVELLNGSNSYLQIDPLPDNQWDTRPGRRKAHTKMRIRVASNGRKPVWIEFPLLLDRPLPKDAIISKAQLAVKRIGMRKKYELKLTMESASFIRKSSGKGVAAIVLACKKQDDNYILAHLVSDNKKRKFNIPEMLGENSPCERYHNSIISDKNGGLTFVFNGEFFDHFRYIYNLRKINDDIFDIVKDKFLIYVKDNKSSFDKWMKSKKNVPSWINEGTKKVLSIQRNKNTLGLVAKLWAQDLIGEEKLNDLVHKWNQERITNEENLFNPLTQISKDSYKKNINDNLEKDINSFLKRHKINGEDKQLAFYMELWRRKERHLYQWERDEAAHADRSRNQLYRLIGKWLSNEFETIVWQDKDLTLTGRNIDPHEFDKEQEPGPVRQIKRILSPGDFRKRIKEYMGKDGTVEISKVNHSKEDDYRKRAENILEAHC